MLRIAFHPLYAHPLPEGHRFPMAKYELIPEQLIYEGTILPAQLFEPEPLDTAIILETHDADYWHRLSSLTLSEKEVRAIGFPLSGQLVRREIVIAKGTLDCALFALSDGVSLNIAGGTHHAFRDRGEGFCLLNDFAIAANYLLSRRLVKKILILDLDVHQGNGTARIFEGNSQVFTFSMHGQHNYPFRKERSTKDIGLPDGTTGTAYLEILERELRNIIDLYRPDFLFFLAGADVLETDRFGKLRLTMQDCRQRDRIVFETALTRGIPVCVAPGGGYSSQLRYVVEAHCNTFRVAKETFER